MPFSGNNVIDPFRSFIGITDLFDGITSNFDKILKMHNLHFNKAKRDPEKDEKIYIYKYSIFITIIKIPMQFLGPIPNGR